jgi:glucose/arabinose dehydrogenase
MKKIALLIIAMVINFILMGCSQDPDQVEPKVNDDFGTKVQVELDKNESLVDGKNNSEDGNLNENKNVGLNQDGVNPDDSSEGVLDDSSEDALEDKDKDQLSFEMEKEKALKRIEASQFLPSTYELNKIFEEVEFLKPLQVSYDYEGSPYVYIVEKEGLIKKINTQNSRVSVFMDLTQVVDGADNETGLLGMAFHPEFPEDPRFFLYYVEDGKSKIVSHRIRKADVEFGYVVAPDSQEDILEFDQPYNNHNGGHIAFGPDGYLYIASGDGGSKGDPDNNAQDLSNLLGKILRINIDYQAGNSNYSIPDDNPFRIDSNKMKEIYAYGLRNPWKFSFDLYRELLMAADVGQDGIEEIDVIIKGGNYGWSRFEGSSLYNEKINLEIEAIKPIYEYSHNEGKSITGGYTYYGESLPSLYGVYIYGDFVSGNIWGLWIDANHAIQNELLLTTNLKISSFGMDGNHELYIVDYNGGIYQLSE